MIYKDFQNLQLSALGFGCMRLPVIDGDDSKVDEQATAEMVDYAIEHGVNYFDTAYGYHNGNSEVALGKALARHPRESYYLADKFPGYDLANMGKVEEIFEEQLARLGVDYFDFYLFHNVYEKNVGPYLDEESFGIMPYLLRQKETGRIKHLGFSAHGSLDVVKRFLDAYGDRMEFCQIQLNYLDWDFQDAKAKVELLNERSIPIWAMEPVRGGKLANLSEQDRAVLAALRPDESPVAWAFRFLQSIPGVTMVLSGMSNKDQVVDNIRTFEDERPLDDKETAALLGIAARMVQSDALPCTACHYCTSHCPVGLDIPYLLSLYNEHVVTGGGFIAPMAVGALPDDKKPNACIGCGSCEAVCPQQLPIPETFAKFSEMIGLGK